MDQMAAAHGNEYKNLSSNVYKQVGAAQEWGEIDQMAAAHGNEYKNWSNNVCKQVDTAQEWGDIDQMAAAHGNEFKNWLNNVCKQVSVYKNLLNDVFRQEWGEMDQMAAAHGNEYKIRSSNVYVQMGTEQAVKIGCGCPQLVTGGGKTNSSLDDALPKTMPRTRRMSSSGTAKGSAQHQEEQPVKKIRRYPFASTPEARREAGEQASSSGRPSQTATTLTPPKITLIYHGSFCPFHPGHMATYQSAARFLSK
eukprot:5333235-Amphidinium_carterae.1